jgi:hypothetical protein
MDTIIFMREISQLLRNYARRTSVAHQLTCFVLSTSIDATSMHG